MSVDVFGRADLKSVITTHTRGPPGIGYKLTSDGQYDVNKKRLCNLAEALNNEDAVNLHVLKKRMINNNKKIIDDLKKLFESSEKSTVETISGKFKLEIEKLSLKLDSNITLVMKLMSEIQASFSKNIIEMRNSLEELTNRVSLLTNNK